jgi:8-oxo-dGTP pyrophosphatase MutT (NUDIX family)
MSRLVRHPAQPAITDHWQRLLANRERRVLALNGYRRAAVLVALVDTPANLLLTERSRDLPSHRGQISFPGGKVDGEETIVAAALREAFEEIGLASQDLVVLGLLDDVWTPQGFHVTPVLARVTAPQPLLKVNRGEVAQLLQVPVADLQQISPRRHLRTPPPGEAFPFGLTSNEVLHYDWPAGDRPADGQPAQPQVFDIWGMTARVIEDLLGLLALSEE